MSNGLFIASTGTDIGKTFVTCALLHQIFRANIQVEAIKPIASGVVPGDAYSDPACLLRAMGKPHHLTAINEICPWRYEKAIAANLAAAAEGKVIDWNRLVQFCEQRLTKPQLTLIEGAGGLMSPITDTRFVLDLICDLNIPVLLVVGNYLGSISHTLTAIETLKSYNIPLQGLVVSESTELSLIHI